MSRPTERQWNYYVDLCVRAGIAPLAKDTFTAETINVRIDALKKLATMKVSSRRSRRRNTNTFGYRGGRMY